jgi:hypothetical protein
MYPSIAFNLLYRRESQSETERRLCRLPKNLFWDLDLSRGQLLKHLKGRGHRPIAGNWTPQG